MINILMLLMILLIFVGVIVFMIRKGSSSLKLMLIGIHITLIGGIIAVDPNSNLVGIEYLIAFSGFIISLIGFGKDD